MKLGTQLHLAGLSLSDTISVLETVGVDRHRTKLHRWVQKADLQPASGHDPNHVALDETVIRLNDEEFWLYAAVNDETTHLLLVRVYPMRNQAITQMFLAELHEERHVDAAVFPVDSAPWLQAALHRHSLRFQHETHGNQNAVERVFREVKR